MKKQLSILSALLFEGFAGLAAGNRPNVVMILSDDQGYADYSFVGHKMIDTPRIDRLWID